MVNFWQVIGVWNKSHSDKTMDGETLSLPIFI